MTQIIIYNALLLATLIYALVAGGQPEKAAALIMALGSFATWLAPFNTLRSYHRVEVVVLVIDSVVLIAFMLIATKANRFWPMWLAALNLISISVHGVKQWQPDLQPTIYAFAVSKASYPMLAIIAMGVLRHRQRLCRYGEDADWSTLRGTA